MNGKTIIFLTIFSLGLIFSCESTPHNNDDAFENFQEDKMMTADGDTVQSKMNKTAVEHQREKKEILSEWTQFNILMNSRMISNETTIEEIKNIPDLDAKIFNEVTELEKENYEMKLELKEYYEVDKKKHERFKKRFAEKMLSLEISIETIKITISADTLMSKSN